MKALSFANLLAVHLIDPTERLNEFDRRSLVWIRIDSSLRFALKTGESWLIKDPLPSDDGGTRDLEALMLHPRAAAKWLLSLPKCRDLVPPGLKAFLERTERPEEREVPALGPVEHERLLAQSRAAATFDPRARRNTVLGLTLPPPSASDGAVGLIKLAPQPAQPDNVLRADIIKVLCGSGSKDESPEALSSHGGPQRPRGKSQPAFERARGIIKELYPNGVPGQATEPNVNLCRQVSAKLKEAELPDVSNDTILRAAGRRK